MADTNSIRRDCAVCSSPLGGLQRMYCGAKCKVQGWREANPVRHAQHRKIELDRQAALRAALKTREWQCGVCQSLFKADRRQSYCSAKCERSVKASKAVVAAEAKHRRDAKTTECAACKAVFCPLYGASHATTCQPCAIERARAYRRAHKLKRTLRLRCAVRETVDPIKVFARDGWKCALCGVDTPAALRGSYDDCAPELDHIVPVSLGGPHTYANTQCACRRCNGRKGARLIDGSLFLKNATRGAVNC